MLKPINQVDGLIEKFYHEITRFHFTFTTE
jgi:hypothetical protein